ncbi:asparagine synthase-related protein [Streptomyces pyxinae]|uniref:asparagine synthase-related protein n=1 Tax=Streptomyces pyxinae TaxID=2970734 RepID=UPI003D17E862
MRDGHATYDATARHLWGLPVRTPLRDTAAIVACHAIPGRQRMRPGDFKPLARAAFTGVVPAVLPDRPDEDRVHRQRLRRSAGQRPPPGAVCWPVRSSPRPDCSTPGRRGRPRIVRYGASPRRRRVCAH